MTRNERATIYAMMIAEIDEPLIYGSKDYGYCRMTQWLFDAMYLLDKLPELKKQEPIHVGAYWFPYGQWTERRQLLVNALLLIDKKMK